MTSFFSVDLPEDEYPAWRCNPHKTQDAWMRSDYYSNYQIQNQLKLTTVGSLHLSASPGVPNGTWPTLCQTVLISPMALWRIANMLLACMLLGYWCSQAFWANLVCKRRASRPLPAMFIPCSRGRRSHVAEVKSSFHFRSCIFSISGWPLTL